MEKRWEAGNFSPAPLVTPVSVCAEDPPVAFAAAARPPKARKAADPARLERLSRPRPGTADKPVSQPHKPPQTAKPVQPLGPHNARQPSPGPSGQAPPWNWQNPKAGPGPAGKHDNLPHTTAKIVAEVSRELDVKVAAMEERLKASFETKLQEVLDRLGGKDAPKSPPSDAVSSAAEVQTGGSLCGEGRDGAGRGSSKEWSSEEGEALLGVVEAARRSAAQPRDEDEAFLSRVRQDPRLLRRLKALALKDADESPRGPARANHRRPHHSAHPSNQDPVHVMTKQMTITQTNSVVLSPRRSGMAQDGVSIAAEGFLRRQYAPRQAFEYREVPAYGAMVRGRHEHRPAPIDYFGGGRRESDEGLSEEDFEEDFRPLRRHRQPPREPRERRSPPVALGPPRRRHVPPPPARPAPRPGGRVAQRERPGPRVEEAAEEDLAPSSSLHDDGPLTMGDWQGDRYQPLPQPDSDPEDVYSPHR